jgi:hypothetical protein
MKEKNKAVGLYIAIFIMAMVVFSFIWAILGFEVFPQYQAFQVSVYPAGVYNVAQLNMIGQMVTWFPLIIVWGGIMWLWINAQNKTGGQDYPSG